MFPCFPATHMLTPTPGERHTAHASRVYLHFLAVFVVGTLGQSAICEIIGLLLPPGRADLQLLAQLFSTAIVAVAVILWCRLGERRSLTSLGLIRRGAWPEYVIGMAAGVILFGGAVGLCVITGTATLSVATEAPSAGLLVLFLAAFLIQGMSEELLCRSFLMVSLSRRWPLWACAVANALAFSLLHIFNPGVTLVALLNIFLFGLLASVLTLRRGSIWMVSALHGLWNFAQGNLFGVPVSGIAGMPAPLVTTLPAERTWWQTLINGGSFGLEGGLAATTVLGLGILAVWLSRTKKSETVEEASIASVAK